MASSGTTEIRDTARSGLVGGMLTQLGPTTLAQCGPDSNSELMLNTVAAAQDYRVRPGGTMLELISPAGGPVLLLTPADAVSAESESGTDSAEATPQPAPQPAPDATAVPSEEPTQSVAGLSPDSIQMELQGLATTFAWEVVAATPVPPGPGGQGFPQHIVLTFDGAAADDVSTYGPIMRIFPVVPYIDLYGSEGQNIVSDQVFRLASLVLEANGRQSVPESPMPLLPPPGSFMNRWAQFADLNFAQGAGVRYVSDSPFRQALGPWTNETTAYYYQGLSDDGAFYISLVWPVATSTLPDSEASVSAETMEQASNPETSAAYHSEVIATLNAVPDAEWSPTLEQLDALVSSLTFVDNP